MSQQLTPAPSSFSPHPSAFARRQPSQRDLGIYRRVKIQRHPQYEVAVDFELKYSRISQIVKKVGQWLAAGGDPIDPQIKDHIARQQLSRTTHKLRLARAIELATAAMEAETVPLTTKRKRTVHGAEIWCEETTRDQADINLPAVRLLVRATEALDKLNNRNDPEPEPTPQSEQNLFPAVHGLLCRWRAQAAASGRVPPVPDIPALTTTLLNTFLGTTPESTIDSSPVALDVVAGLPTEPPHLTPQVSSLAPAVPADLPTEPPVLADDAPDATAAWCSSANHCHRSPADPPPRTVRRRFSVPRLSRILPSTKEPLKFNHLPTEQ